ncbi:MAG: S-layer protein [Polaromonas sp.]|nr:S-layer protein [Polaromonas sp.]
MSLPIFGAQAAVSILNRVFTNSSPANAVFANQVNNATASLAAGANSTDVLSYTAFAKSFGTAYATQTPAALSTLMLTNMGLLPNAALEAALTDYITAAGVANVGIVALQLSSILSAIPTTDVNYGAAARAWDAEVTSAFTYSSNTANTTAQNGDVVQPPATQGQTLTLTTNADNFTGTSANDTFNAAGAGLWSVGDTLNGGDGTDTLNVTQSGAITKPVGTTVSNIEIVNLLTDAAVTLNSTTGFTGLTNLNVTSSAATANTLTAAATTDVSATFSGLVASGTAQQNINGGKDITVTATGTTAAATALTPATGANAEILIGATTAAAGKVTVTNSGSGADTTASGDIFVKGGTEVSVTQKLTNTTVAATNVQGDVSVVGTAATTKVTVVQDATAAASATGTGVVGKTAGAVTVTDVNAASTTAAGSITTVTLTNAGAATVNSGALTTLNLGGTLVTVDAGTLGALTTPANTALALGLTGARSTGAVTIDSDIKTLNVSGNTTASTIASLVASGATAINVSGDAKVTFTANTTAAVTDIVVTNTGGAAFGTALGTAVNFTGGAGADSIVLSAGFTKAITMGAGDDTVTYNGAAGTGGSVAAGDGTDTVIMTTANSAAVSANSTFNTKFTGFEVLRVSDAHTATVDLDGVNAASKVVLAAGSNGGTINNLVSGGTIDMLASGGGALTVGVKSALVGATDVLNLNLKSTSVLAAGTVTAANVETINIGLADATTVTPTALGAAAVIHTMTLAATSATSVVVTGNNGLTLTNTGNTAITNFDASGVVANDTAQGAGFAATSDTAANLAVTFASANTTATANVTIKGGAGNDVLSGTIAKDTISGGAGADYIYADNAGTKEIQTLTLTHVTDAGTDTITINGIAVTYTTSTTAALDATAAAAAINANASLKGLVTASAATNVVTITSLTDGDLVTSTVTGGNSTAVVATTTAGTAGTVATDVIDGGAGNDVLVGGGGVDTITTGAGADTVFFLKGHSNAATMATITDYTYAVGGASNDKIILGDVTTVIGTTTTVQDLSAQTSLANALGAAALTNTVDNGLSVFLYGGDTYAFVETTGATGTYVASDFVVKLTGVVMASGATIAGSGFDAV